MKIKKIVVDELPRTCHECKFGINRECGKAGMIELFGMKTIGLIPDERCLLEESH